MAASYEATGRLTSTGITVSGSVPCTSGANRIILASASNRGSGGNNTALSTFTYDSTGGTLLGSMYGGNDPASGNHSRQYVYYWLASALPSAGSYTMAATFEAESDQTQILWVEIHEAKQTPPSPVDIPALDADGNYVTTDPAAIVGFEGNQDDVNMNAVAAGSGIMVQMFTGRAPSSPGTGSVDSGQTLLGQGEADDMLALWSYKLVASSGSVQMDHSWTVDGGRFAVNSVLWWQSAPAPGAAGLDVGAGALMGV